MQRSTTTCTYIGPAPLQDSDPNSFGYLGDEDAVAFNPADAPHLPNLFDGENDVPPSNEERIALTPELIESIENLWNTFFPELVTDRPETLEDTANTDLLLDPLQLPPSEGSLAQASGDITAVVDTLESGPPESFQDLGEDEDRTPTPTRSNTPTPETPRPASPCGDDDDFFTFDPFIAATLDNFTWTQASVTKPPPPPPLIDPKDTTSLLLDPPLSPEELAIIRKDVDDALAAGPSGPLPDAERDPRQRRREGPISFYIPDDPQNYKPSRIESIYTAKELQIVGFVQSSVTPWEPDGPPKPAAAPLPSPRLITAPSLIPIPAPPYASAQDSGCASTSTSTSISQSASSSTGRKRKHQDTDAPAAPAAAKRHKQYIFCQWHRTDGSICNDIIEHSSGPIKDHIVKHVREDAGSPVELDATAHCQWARAQHGAAVGGSSVGTCGDALQLRGFGRHIQRHKHVLLMAMPEGGEGVRVPDAFCPLCPKTFTIAIDGDMWSVKRHIKLVHPGSDLAQSVEEKGFDLSAVIWEAYERRSLESEGKGKGKARAE